MSDNAVDHPSHYTQGTVEVIELVSRLGFCAGNVIKYILRAPYKGNLETDLGKARWYLKQLYWSPGSPQHQLLDSWADILDTARKFDSPAVDAVVEYCVSGSTRDYARALNEIDLLEKNHERQEQRED